MRELWHGLQQELAALVLPVGCAGCGRPRVRGQLCQECSSALTGAVPRRVWPSPVPSGLPAVYGAMPYADEARAVLLAHKERGALCLAGPLGAVLAGPVRMAAEGAGRAGRTGERAERTGRGGRAGDPWRAGRAEGPGHSGPRRSGRTGTAAPTRAETGTGQGRPRTRARPHTQGSGRTWPPGGTDEPVHGLTLVPVPSARRAVAGRGHDPVRRITLAAARDLRRQGLPVRVLAVLRQRRTVVDQAGLTAEQRLANLNGALEAAPGSGGLLEEGRTVLVDDLMTTGASLVEAARAVEAAGGSVTGAAVLASRSAP